MKKIKKSRQSDFEDFMKKKLSVYVYTDYHLQYDIPKMYLESQLKD